MPSDAAATRIRRRRRLGIEAGLCSSIFCPNILSIGCGQKMSRLTALKIAVWMPVSYLNSRGLKLVELSVRLPNWGRQEHVNSATGIQTLKNRKA